jgi:hypothetical protein
MFSAEESASPNCGRSTFLWKLLYLLTKQYGVTDHKNIILTFAAVSASVREQFFEHSSIAAQSLSARRHHVMAYSRRHVRRRRPSRLRSWVFVAAIKGHSFAAWGNVLHIRNWILLDVPLSLRFLTAKLLDKFPPLPLLFGVFYLLPLTLGASFASPYRPDRLWGPT